MKRTAVASFLLFSLVGTPTHASGQETVLYHWRTESTDGPSALRAGHDVSIAIDGLDYACYDYSASFVIRHSRQDLSKTDFVNGLTATGGVPPATEVPPRPAPPAKGTDSTALVRQDLSLWVDLLARASRLADAALVDACQARGGRGVTLEGSALDTLITTVNRAWARRASFESHANSVKVSSDLNSLRSSAISQRLSARTDSLRHLALLLSASARDGSKIRRSVHLSGDADSLLVILTAKGRDDIAAVKGKTLVDTVGILVNRRFRLYSSVGWMVSALDSHDYERETRVVRRTSTSTDTVSTFVDLSGSGSTVTSPIAVVSVSLLGSPDGAGLALSSGVVARSVDDKVRPEFLVGLSGSLRDRFLLTLGVHFGREEKLLLDSTGVEDVPVSVTKESAVGTVWDAAFAGALSIVIK